MTTLYPKQAEQLGEVRLGFRSYESILLQSPTGSGKTQIGTAAAKSAAEKGNSVIWLTHRKELLEQTSKTFSKAGVPPFRPHLGPPTTIRGYWLPSPAWAPWRIGSAR